MWVQLLWQLHRWQHRGAGNRLHLKDDDCISCRYSRELLDFLLIFPAIYFHVIFFHCRNVPSDILSLSGNISSDIQKETVLLCVLSIFHHRPFPSLFRFLEDHKYNTKLTLFMVYIWFRPSDDHLRSLLLSRELWSHILVCSHLIITTEGALKRPLTCLPPAWDYPGTSSAALPLFQINNPLPRFLSTDWLTA